MQTFQITPPNTCALVVTGSDIAYVETVPSAEIYADNAAVFSQYLTPEDALTAALVIDPGYNGDKIIGGMPFTVDTETGAGEYFYGDPISLQYAVSSTVSSTVSYQWYEDELEIPGATSTTLTLGDANSSIAGPYSCQATITATDGSNRSVLLEGLFNVSCVPVVGDFTLTRSGNDITTGLFTYFRGFTATTATLEVPATGLTISYDPVDGFKTTGSPLGVIDQVAELFINGVFVKAFTIHAVSGTFSYNFAA